jgi:hypothetical protein
VKADLMAARHYLKPNGVLAGHDWHFETVRRAVREFCSEMNLNYPVRFEDTSWMIPR